MKKSKLLIVLSIIFYCLAGSMSAVKGKLSEAMYNKAVQQYNANKDNALLASLRTFGDIVDEDGSGLGASVKNKIFNLIKNGKSYAQYIASLGASSPPPPPPPTGHTAPPPPPPVAEKATAPDSVSLGGRSMEIAGKTVDQIVRAVQAIPDPMGTVKNMFQMMTLKNIEPQAVRQAISDKLFPKKKSTGSGSGGADPKVVTKPADGLVIDGVTYQVKGKKATEVIKMLRSVNPVLLAGQIRRLAPSLARSVVQKALLPSAPDSFGDKWLKANDHPGTTQDLVKEAGSDAWEEGIRQLVFNLIIPKSSSPKFQVVQHGSLKGKCKLLTSQVTPVKYAGAYKVALEAKNYYPAPMEAFEAAWARVFPDGNATTTFPDDLEYGLGGVVIADPQNIPLIKNECLRIHIGMNFEAASSSAGTSSGTSHGPSTGTGGSTSAVELPADWVQRAAQWFKDQGKSEVKTLYMGACIAAVGAPAGFASIPGNRGFQKDGQQISMSKVVDAVSAAFAALGSSSGGSGSSASVDNRVNMTQTEYEKALADANKASGPFKRLAVNQLAKVVTAANSQARVDLIDALMTGTSYADFKAAHPDYFGGATGGPPPPPPHSHTTPPPPPPPGHSSGSSEGSSASVDNTVNMTQVEYEKALADANKASGPFKRLAVNQIAKVVTAANSKAREDLIDALMAGTSYADFKAAHPDYFGGSGPHPETHAPPPPPPPGSTSGGSSSTFTQPDLTDEEVEQLAQTYDAKLQSGGEGFAGVWLESNRRGRELWAHKEQIKKSQRDRVIAKAAEIKAARDAASHEGAPTGFTDDGSPFKFADYAAWKAACAPLPGCIHTWKLNGWDPASRPWKEDHYYQQSALGPKDEAVVEYQKALHRVFTMMKSDPHLTSAAQWLGDAGNVEEMLNASYMKGSPQIYAEKQMYGEDDVVVFFGDLHGDVHSLLKAIDTLQAQGYMDGFRITNPRVNLVFLGDYCDRGMYGVEVIYTLLRLALANPANVTFVRGNHEDLNITAKYGFQAECMFKLGTNLGTEHQALYNLLPAVLYVGVGDNFLQCCHGGFEIGYKPAALLASSKKYQQLGELNQTEFLDAHASIKAKMNNMPGKTFRAAFPGGYDPNIGGAYSNCPKLGFMWNDFLKTGEYKSEFGRGIACGSGLTRDILTAISTGSQKLRGVVRAHQHEMEVNEDNPSNLMGELINSNGFYTMWQPISTAAQRPLPAEGTVFMLNVAPDTPYGEGCNFGFATVAALQFKDAYEDWRFNVVTQQVVMPSVVTGIGVPKPVTAGPSSGGSAHHTGDASAASKAVDQLLGLNQTLQLAAAAG